MKLSKIAIGLALLCSALIGLFLHHALTAKQPHARQQEAKAGVVEPRDGNVDAELTRLRAEMAELRAIEYARLQNTAAPSASTETVALPVQPPREALTPADRERRIEEDRARSRERMEFLATALDREPRDRAWGSQMESRVTNAVSPVAFPGTHVESTDCRSTLCRVVLSHDDANAAAAIGTFPMSVPDFAEGVLTASNDAKGRPLTIGYFARTGHKLPQDEAASAKF